MNKQNFIFWGVLALTVIITVPTAIDLTMRAKNAITKPKPQPATS